MTGPHHPPQRHRPRSCRCCAPPEGADLQEARHLPMPSLTWHTARWPPRPDPWEQRWRRRIPLKRRVRVVVLLPRCAAQRRQAARFRELRRPIRKNRLRIRVSIGRRSQLDIREQTRFQQKTHTTQPHKTQQTQERAGECETIESEARAQNRMLPTPLVERNMPLVAPVILEIFEFIAALRAIKSRASLSSPMVSRRSSSSESSS